MYAEKIHKIRNHFFLNKMIYIFSYQLKYYCSFYRRI